MGSLSSLRRFLLRKSLPPQPHTTHPTSPITVNQSCGWWSDMTILKVRLPYVCFFFLLDSASLRLFTRLLTLELLQFPSLSSPWQRRAIHQRVVKSALTPSSALKKKHTRESCSRDEKGDGIKRKSYFNPDGCWGSAWGPASSWQRSQDEVLLRCLKKTNSIRSGKNIYKYISTKKFA